MFERGVKFCFVLLAGSLLFLHPLQAQQLGETLPRSNVSNLSVNQNSDYVPAWQFKAQQNSGFEVQSKDGTSNGAVSEFEKQPTSWNPWSDTKDGSQRGTIGFDKLRNDGSLSNSYIFVYYDNFSINKSMTGDVRCSMRFVVTTTLDRKLNNLSMKLKWPEMETAMTFQNIMPNVDAYQYYTLLGEGCYSMDKIPNIIVNRCRVADMSAQSCASKIRWLRKR